MGKLAQVDKLMGGLFQSILMEELLGKEMNLFKNHPEISEVLRQESERALLRPDGRLASSQTKTTQRSSSHGSQEEVWKSPQSQKNRLDRVEIFCVAIERNLALALRVALLSSESSPFRIFLALRVWVEENWYQASFAGVELLVERLNAGGRD